MGAACSSTWFLIVTLLAWALVACVAALSAPQTVPPEERGALPVRAPHKTARRFMVARAPRSSALRLYALASEAPAARSLTSST
jgi:hypothetical protein